MSFLNKLKTIVSKSSGSHSLVLASNSSPPGSKITSNINKFISALNGEKEWECPCGHKFRDSAEWFVCAPALCEVPSCPNKKFYIDGPGRALLEANSGGITMKSVSTSKKKSVSTDRKSEGGAGSRI